MISKLLKGMVLISIRKRFFHKGNFLTIINFRCHLVTDMHRKIRDKIRQTRADKIWLSCEDMTQAFKPMKMGLRLANL